MRPIDAVLNGLQSKPMYEGLPADDDPRRHREKQIAKRRARNKAARKARHKAARKARRV